MSFGSFVGRAMCQSGNCIKLIHKKVQNVDDKPMPLAPWRLHTSKLQTELYLGEVITLD